MGKMTYCDPLPVRYNEGMFHITDDYGTAVYFDDDGDPVTCESCIESYEHPMFGTCGDCYGGYEVDPGVYGPGPDRRFYDGGRLIDPDDPASLALI
jgi:hypothetical protein